MAEVAQTTPRHQSPVAQALAVVVLLQTVGAVRLLVVEGSTLARWWWLHAGLAEASMATVDAALGIALILCATVLLIKPGAKARLAAGVIAAWFLLDSLLVVTLGGSFASELAPFGRSLRFVVPGVLALGLVDKERATALRLAVATVFAAHGAEALLLHPQFIDFLIVCVERFTGARMTEASASVALRFIGAMDIAVAAWLVARPRREVMAWAAFWGLLTAFVRVVYFGVESGWAPMALRAANGGVPLVFCLLIWSASRTERQDVVA